MERASAVVIGGGPAGLMAAEVLLQGGVPVNLYEAMPSTGRKFLVAGKGGLNLTHSEPYPQFLTRYGPRRPQLEPLLDDFGPEALQQWAYQLGIETFVGSSGRVFPLDMKALPLLRAWQQRLRQNGLTIFTRHQWLGWADDGHTLRFQTPAGEMAVQAGVVVLALGGGSWAKLGSTGAWVPLLAQRGVTVAPLKPANCGFNVAWSAHFSAKFEGQPLKAVAVSFTTQAGVTHQRRGEFIITRNGVEGSLIYALSAPLRDELEATGQAIIYLDLAPDWPLDRLAAQLARPQGRQSTASHLKKTIGLHGVKTGLLWEFVPKEVMAQPAPLAAAIKALPVPLLSPRPLDEAISSAGGVAFEALTPQLMLKAIPGVFCAGEMLDWEAPTGGYLLQASFATGAAAGRGALDWLKRQTTN